MKKVLFAAPVITLLLGSVPYRAESNDTCSEHVICQCDIDVDIVPGPWGPAPYEIIGKILNFNEEDIKVDALDYDYGRIVHDNLVDYADDIEMSYFNAKGETDALLVLKNSEGGAGDHGGYGNFTPLQSLESIKVTFDEDVTLSVFVSKDYGNLAYNKYAAKYDLVSGEVISLDEISIFPECSFFMLVNESDAPITITDIELTYFEGTKHDGEVLFSADPLETRQHTARTLGRNIDIKSHSIDFDTGSVDGRTNTSTGTSGGYANSWYRWQGVALLTYGGDVADPDYESAPYGEYFSDEGFRVTTAVIADTDRYFDETSLYHAAPWIEYANSARTASNEIWGMGYAGNDNYDPTGSGGLAGRSDTYEGRFLTRYEYKEGSPEAWVFYGPDDQNIFSEGGATYKEQYENALLPLYHFDFNYENLGVVGPSDALLLFETIINGQIITRDVARSDDYTKFADGMVGITNMHFHGVNYGDATGNSLPGYHLTYSMPRVYY